MRTYVTLFIKTYKAALHFRKALDELSPEVFLSLSREGDNILDEVHEILREEFPPNIAKDLIGEEQYITAMKGRKDASKNP